MNMEVVKTTKGGHIPGSSVDRSMDSKLHPLDVCIYPHEYYRLALN